MSQDAKKILIIEDERPLAHALELKLTKQGFSTSRAIHGEHALEILEKEEFSLILLDLMMPRVDGFSVLEHLKTLMVPTPVIVLSNLSQEEDIKRAKELGAKDFFVKSDTPITYIVEHIKTFLL